MGQFLEKWHLREEYVRGLEQKVLELKSHLTQSLAGIESYIARLHACTRIHAVLFDQ
jgi:hypothetical protein